MSGAMVVGRYADGQGAVSRLVASRRPAPRRPPRPGWTSRGRRRRGRGSRPRPNELPSTVQEQGMAHGRCGGATRQAARAFGDRPGVAEFLGVGQGRHASSHGTLERLAPRDGLGEDRLPSLAAGLLGRLGRQRWGTGGSRGGLTGSRAAGPAADQRGGPPSHLQQGVAPRVGASELRQQPTDGGYAPGIHRLDPRRVELICETAHDA